MPFHKRLFIFSIAMSGFLVTFFQRWIFQNDQPLIVLEEFYDIPILAGGFFFGLKGALIILFSEFPAESIIKKVDSLRLQRALTHLISNAVEASPAGREVRLTVTKNQEKLDNVFIPFFSKKTQETGLGMAMAKKVIEAIRETSLSKAGLTGGRK